MVSAKDLEMVRKYIFDNYIPAPKSNGWFSQKDIEFLKERYPVGTKVELVSMDDVQAPAPGTKGIVKDVDDAGNVLVAWENGSSLSLISSIDKWKIVK